MLAKKILVIDDEQDIRDVLSEYFNLKGFLVEAVSDGKEGLKRMEEFTPNIILLDYAMPRATGLDLFPKFREMFPYVKVVVITGRGTEAVAVRALKMGIDDYITKPFDLDVVGRAVDYYLRKQLEELVALNRKYIYPLDTDEILNRYEYIRLVHERPDLGVKTISNFFTFSRQDFYNYLGRLKKWGAYGLFGERELKTYCQRFKETRLKERVQIPFKPLLGEGTKRQGRKSYRLENFINAADPIQMKLEMLREAATQKTPHIGKICNRFGITREAFYQTYRAFQEKGVFGLLPRRKGRPRKDDSEE
ncbi:MAG TPA: response regulator [bacterium]|nr:response regulator [bacterium]HPQ66058.1 response regulator [bacterium]